MTLFISPPIAMSGNLGVAFRRNGIFGILSLDIVQNFICCVSSVSQDITVRNIYMWEYIHSYGGIMNVSRRKLKVKRIAKTINNGMNFGSLTTTTSTNKLILFAIYSPFLAPALCWCAFTLVESSDKFSISASTLSAWNRRRNVLSSLHLRNRL